MNDENVSEIVLTGDLELCVFREYLSSRLPEKNLKMIGELEAQDLCALFQIGIEITIEDYNRKYIMTPEMNPALLGLLETLPYKTEDYLTGLKNRRGLDNELEKAKSLFVINEKGFTLVYIDLDNFKKVNTNLGYLEGDNVLKNIGVVAKQQIRLNDVISRFGGDEFGLLLPETTLREGVEIAERFRKSIAREIKVGEINIYASMGVSHYTSTSQSLISLKKDANDALIFAKSSGKNKVAVANEGRIKLVA